MDSKNNFKEALEFCADTPLYYIQRFVDRYIPTEQQQEIFKILPKAIKEGKSIAIKSGHGIGKTAAIAVIILWFISVFPFPKIVATAPSKGQLLDVLWPEIKKWQRNFRFGKDYEWTKTRLSHSQYGEDWFASARTSNKPEAMAGIHGEHVLLIFEEASGIPQEVFTTMEGAETDEGALKILISNPTKTTGAFYDAFHKNKEEYYTFTFSCLDSPRVKKGYAEKIARKYGINSNIYRVRVLGEFPLQEDDVIIGIDTVERAQERFMNLSKEDIEKIQSEGDEISFGVDVARFGDDESTIYTNIGTHVFKEKVIAKNDTMQLASIVANLRKHKYKNFKKAYFNIDETGVGSGTLDRLYQLQGDGELPEDDIILGVANNRRAIDSQEYANIISELWFAFGKFLKDEGSLQPDDLEELNNIQQQLCSRKYFLDSKGRIIIESKDNLKKRLSGVSPDRADGAILSRAHKILPDVMTSVGSVEETKPVEELKEQNEDFKNKTSMKSRLAFYKNR